MRIAVVGWGSLIWSPRTLAIQSRWYRTGPQLPIEFARRANNGRLTLVIHTGSVSQQAYWSVSALAQLDAARENLREREGSALADIHCVTRSEVPEQPAARLVHRWLVARPELDAAIWTGLPATLEGEIVSQAVAYLTGLDEMSDTFRIAREYVVNTPPQIQTAVRRAMQLHGWTDAVLSEALFETDQT